MRCFATLAVLPIFLTACASAPGPEVAATGGETARLVLRFIRLAEAGNEAEFRSMTARTAFDDDGGSPQYPLDLDSVDRRDEGCSLKSVAVYFDVERLSWVEALWKCREDHRHNVERMFVVENGRITQMWNAWAEPDLVSPADITG
jgi:hypothetical protein